MMMRASRLAAFVLSIVAFLHLLRLIFHVDFIVGGVLIPMWASGIACLGPAVLAVFLWREGSR